MYKFNYIDQAASAGFSYQRQLEGAVYVCVDEDKAQAYVMEKNKQRWLKVYTSNSRMYPILLVDQECILTDTQFCVPLEEFNRLYGKRF